MNYGLGNSVKPFKKRNVELNKPVWVYRNLNCRGVVYSIKQKGLVVGHATQLMLGDVKFKVSEAGRKRVIKTNRKNVHAYIIGKIRMHGGMGTTAKQCEERNIQLPVIIKYNPKTHKGFTCENSKIKFIVTKAVVVILNKYGVSAAMTDI